MESKGIKKKALYFTYRDHVSNMKSVS